MCASVQDEVCTTQYQEECRTEPGECSEETQCRTEHQTVTKQECHTVEERQCRTFYRPECETRTSQECGHRVRGHRCCTKSLSCLILVMKMRLRMSDSAMLEHELTSYYHLSDHIWIPVQDASVPGDGRLAGCRNVSVVDCRNVPQQECSVVPRQQCVVTPTQVASQLCSKGECQR